MLFVFVPYFTHIHAWGAGRDGGGRGAMDPRTGLENIKNMIFSIFFDIFDIFQKMKISNKLYNNGCNTLMQYLMTIVIAVIYAVKEK